MAFEINVGSSSPSIEDGYVLVRFSGTVLLCNPDGTLVLSSNYAALEFGPITLRIDQNTSRLVGLECRQDLRFLLPTFSQPMNFPEASLPRMVVSGLDGGDVAYDLGRGKHLARRTNFSHSVLMVGRRKGTPCRITTGCTTFVNDNVCNGILLHNWINSEEPVP